MAFKKKWKGLTIPLKDEPSIKDAALAPEPINGVPFSFISEKNRDGPIGLWE